MTPRFSRYISVRTAPFHYPGGVICTGETALLPDAFAQRGLASGQLISISTTKNEVK